MSAENPYASAELESVESVVLPYDQGLEYQQSVKFVFENPNWIVNVLIAALCIPLGVIIPILPGLVLLGYQCEMLEALVVRPGERYPDFKFERIMDYMIRGVWPFLVALIGSLVVVPIMLVMVIIPVIGMGVMANAVGQNNAGYVIGIMVPVIACVAVLTVGFCNVVLLPFLFRAALTQDIGAALDFQFAKDFVGRMWKETVFAGLFLIAVAIAAQIVGLALFCIGVFVTVPIVQFAQVHLGMQLYRLYLARGGEKIPLKSVAAVPAS